MRGYAFILMFAAIWLATPAYNQTVFPESEESPVWVVDNKNFGINNCYIYIAGETFEQQDTLWTEIIRFFHPSSNCSNISYDQFFEPTNSMLVGYYSTNDAQVYGKKTTDGTTFLLYDFSLLATETTSVLFNFTNPALFDPINNNREIRIANIMDVELADNAVARLELTQESSPFPAYVDDMGNSQPEYWIPTVSSTANPFSAFECVAFGCENSFRLYALYTGEKKIRYHVDGITPISTVFNTSSLEIKVLDHQLFVQQNTAKELNLSLFTIQGQLIAQFSTAAQESFWQLPTLSASGIYVIQGTQEGTHFLEKIWLEKR